METVERTVGAYEAKTKLPQLLEEVAKGEKIVITKHGVPVAMLVPYIKTKRPDPQEAVEALRKWQAEHRLSLGGLTIRELIEEGRR